MKQSLKSIESANYAKHTYCINPIYNEVVWDVSEHLSVLSKSFFLQLLCTVNVERKVEWKSTKKNRLL